MLAINMWILVQCRWYTVMSFHLVPIDNGGGGFFYTSQKVGLLAKSSYMV